MFIFNWTKQDPSYSTDMYVLVGSHWSSNGQYGTTSTCLKPVPDVIFTITYARSLGASSMIPLIPTQMVSLLPLDIHIITVSPALPLITTTPLTPILTNLLDSPLLVPISPVLSLGSSAILVHYLLHTLLLSRLPAVYPLLSFPISFYSTKHHLPYLLSSSINLIRFFPIILEMIKVTCHHVIYGPYIVCTVCTSTYTCTPYYLSDTSISYLLRRYATVSSSA